MPVAKLATLLTALGLGAAVCAPGSALAWGGSGHRMIGQAAMESLPTDLPAFLRTPKAARLMGELAREPDRWKDAGKLHDRVRDPAHFLDLSDDGTILGGPKLDALPATIEDYDTAMRVAGSNSWKAGTLPYAIIDAAQQVAKDFAMWRGEGLALAREKDKAKRAWLIEDRAERENLILQNIGVLAHYVGDGSQPLHVSVHFNGWGDYLNPKGYTAGRIHGMFEGDFVAANVREPAVRAAMTKPKTQQGSLEARVAAYLAATGAQVEPLYALEKAGAFSNPNTAGIDFTTARVAAGASELRDLIVDAWNVSPQIPVGWPKVSLSDIEAGKVDAYRAFYNKD
jgi:hypothetical protein